MSRLLRTRHAADYLGVSKQFLERDRWQGATIPFVTVGVRGIRYREEDLEAYLKSRTYIPNGRKKR